jgi:hypothetical protein
VVKWTPGACAGLQADASSARGASRARRVVNACAHACSISAKATRITRGVIGARLDVQAPVAFAHLTRAAAPCVGSALWGHTYAIFADVGRCASIIIQT